MRALRAHLAYRNIKRLRHIVGVLLKHGFQPLMERLHMTRLLSVPARLAGRRRAREQELLTEPQRLRLALEELGPTFIKVGQVLSTRPDILPDEYIEELLKLQDRIPPVPFSEVARVIERELGKPWNKLFREINRKPVAAASIAQVHRAVTLSGTEVVIKVQRPGIEETIATDISILRYLAGLLERHVPESRPYDPVGVADEISTIIQKELNFKLEASFTEKFRENFSGDPRVVVPGVYWDLSARRVLTLDRIRGVKVNNVSELDARGIDRGKVARLLIDVFFKEVFELGLFHGDLHAGNIFVMGEEKIALVDFGIVGRVDRKMQRDLADILINLIREDYEALTKVYFRMGILPEDIDRTRFKREYADTLVHFLARPASDVSFGELLMDHVRLASRHHVRLPSEFILFDKCVIELEGLTRHLDPAINIIDASEPYAMKLFKKKMDPRFMIEEGLSAAADYKVLFRDFPVRAASIMEELAEGRMRIEFLHRGLDTFMREMDRSSNRLTFGLIISALVIASALVITSGVKPLLFGYPIIGILGFLVASFLGLWLVVQILRSGKL
jgi:ubiquinone biosynthesis protein